MTTTPTDPNQEHTHHATDPAEGFDEDTGLDTGDEIRVHAEEPAEGADTD